MLILARGVSEEICIGSDIRVMVTKIKPSAVMLGVAAPKGVPIHRAEVYDDITSLQGTPAVPAELEEATRELLRTVSKVRTLVKPEYIADEIVPRLNRVREALGDRERVKAFGSGMLTYVPDGRNDDLLEPKGKR